MNERNYALGTFYFVLFLILAPILFGGIASIVWWAPTGAWFPVWLLYVIGLILTAYFITPLVPKMYIINDAYTVSFHLDAFFGPNSTVLSGKFDEIKQLIARGPGFHFIGWWEKFDSTTHHEKEITLDLKGKFETSGDNLNLDILGGLMILKAPIESARQLRSVAKGMDTIVREIKTQLEPSLRQATAYQFIKHDSDHIMKSQPDIATTIREDFERFNLIKERYGLETVKFVLGDINFSPKINEAREAAKAATLRGDAAKQIAKDLDIDGKAATEFVLASENLARVTIDRNVYEISGLSPDIVIAVKETAEAIKEIKKGK
jgi:hypothetical protein